MPQHEHDLVVIGAGPGGYVCAIRAAQLGLNVACVEKEKALGGTCLRVGCIPSKALLQSSEIFEQTQHHLAEHGIDIASAKLDLQKMIARKDAVVTQLTKGVEALFKKNKVKRYHGLASFNESGSIQVGDDELLAEHVVIATGSKVATLPGVDLDTPHVDSSTEALSYETVPKHLAVIGAGYIGLEIGSVWRRLGSEVTVIEYLDRILPGMDAEIAGEAKKMFEKQGLKFMLNEKVTGVTSIDKGKKDKGVKVWIGEANKKEGVEADRVLVAVGRKPNTDGLGLEKIGLELDERGRVETDDSLRTARDGVWAIGDVVAGPMLAHKAEEEGVAVAERIATGHGHVNYDTIPGIVYTHPEIATVGKTEEQLQEAGTEYLKGMFPFLANGRAKAIGETTGKVKILADATTDRILGVHILGPRAGDLIAECAVAMEFGATSEDLARCCHAHPTLAEAVKEAALAVADRAIHF